MLTDLIVLTYQLTGWKKAGILGAREHLTVARDHLFALRCSLAPVRCSQDPGLFQWAYWLVFWQFYTSPVLSFKLNCCLHILSSWITSVRRSFVISRAVSTIAQVSCIIQGLGAGKFFLRPQLFFFSKRLRLLIFFLKRLRFRLQCFFLSGSDSPNNFYSSEFILIINLIWC